MTSLLSPNSTPANKLRELLTQHDMTQLALARLWVLSPPYVCDLVGGRRSITVRTALRLEATFGSPSAEEWLDLQRDQELRVLRQDMASELTYLRQRRVSRTEKPR